ncbi:MAG: argininosuccinate lyase [Acidobacteria bacterium]|nr:argininosuccinate lyase [Acidobacteriota bacterium]
MKLWQGRFEEDSDPVFEKMNRSLGTDAVLLEVDIRASRAHARSLLGCGVLSQEEWKSIDQGLEQILSEYTPDQVKATPYEDIHTFVEATLAAKIGPAAGKLHTGRSRNDQVATDFRLFVRKAIGLVMADLEALQHALIECGARNSDVIIPAYTHLRRAQPIRWSHYCLAYVEMFGRDSERFEQSLGRLDVMPLGSGAAAGSNFPVDREAVAKELGFSKISANSLDATCDRDFVLEFLSNAAIGMAHASRLAEDWILYSTEEFGFLELSEKVTTGSSLMPQKKNPDGLELIRAKTAMTIGLLTGFLAVMKGLPTGYNKDLQEDKEAFLKAFDNVRLCLSVLRLSVRTVVLKTERTDKAAADSFMGATDLADFLVMKGVPFRTAHEIVARAVREALEQNKQLSEIDLSAHSSFFLELPSDYLTPENIVNRKGHSAVLCPENQNDSN